MNSDDLNNLVLVLLVHSKEVLNVLVLGQGKLGVGKDRCVEFHHVHFAWCSNVRPTKLTFVLFRLFLGFSESRLSCFLRLVCFGFSACFFGLADPLRLIKFNVRSLFVIFLGGEHSAASVLDNTCGGGQ